MPITVLYVYTSRKTYDLNSVNYLSTTCCLKICCWWIFN